MHSRSVKNVEFITSRNGQIILLCIVIFIGIGGTALGALSIRNNITGVFGSGEDSEKSAFSYNIAQGETSSSVDIDGDGLTETDELSIHNTSPYLADSDSDGINDGAEVSSGTDPNCPQGQQCSGSQIVSSPSDFIEDSRNDFVDGQITTTQSGNVLDNADSNDVNGISSVSPSLSAQALSSLSPAEIRQLLLSQGVEESLLKGLTDDQVVTIFKQTLEGLN